MALGALLFAGAGHAHGPAPAPLSVLRGPATPDEVRPALVLTNIGLARRAGEEWVYGCPSEWDLDGDDEYDEITPLAAATDELVVVAGDPGLYVSKDQGCSFGAGAPAEDIPARDVLALVGLPERVLALVDDGSSKDLADAETGARVFTAHGDLHSALATDDQGVLLGGVMPGQAPQVRLVLLDESFVEKRAWLVPAPGAEVDRVRLRRVELDEDGSLGTVWLSAAVGGGVELWRVDGEQATVLHGPVTAVHGPVALCGGVAFAAGGALHEDPGSPPACDLSALDDATVRCLQERDGRVYLCDVFTLVHVDEGPEGLRTAPVFALDELSAPELSCLDGAADARCTAAWVHFGAEAGLLDDETPDAGPDPDEDPAPLPGCRAAGRSEPAPAVGLALAALVGAAFTRSARRRAAAGRSPGR